MSSKTDAVYIATTTDTKGRELDFVRKVINRHGVKTVTIDLSTKPHKSDVKADISAQEIAAYHPRGAEAVFCGERGKAIEAMSLAFTHFISARSDVAAMLGLGGSGGTALITPAMQALPIGVPKLMVSTMASGDTSPYVGSSDIAMLYSVTDVAGINRISRKILMNAAAQITGAVLFTQQEGDTQDPPALGLTMFGVTTPCVRQVTEGLESQYDCLVFHATGSGGNAMEKLAGEGLLDGILDLTLTEICDMLFGGVLACSPTRLDVVARTRLPWVGSCGALDMINFSSMDKVPEHYRQRQLFVHNAQVTLMRTTPEENAVMGQWIAEKLNQCDGEIRFLIPMQGFSSIDAKGQAFWSPKADLAFIHAFESHFKQTPKRRMIKLDCNINDAEFADAAIRAFREATTL